VQGNGILDFPIHKALLTHAQRGTPTAALTLYWSLHKIFLVKKIKSFVDKIKTCLIA